MDCTLRNLLDPSDEGCIVNDDDNFVKLSGRFVGRDLQTRDLVLESEAGVLTSSDISETISAVAPPASARCAAELLCPHPTV